MLYLFVIFVLISRAKPWLTSLFDDNICTHVLTTNDGTKLSHFTSCYLICDDNQVR